MRILVTGSSGHLGEALMRTLRAQGHETIGVDRLPSAWTDRIGTLADARFVHDSVAGADAVLHTATLHKPHVATHTRQEFVDTNVTGTLNVLDAVVKDPASGAVEIGGVPVALARTVADAKSGDRVSLALRPETISMTKEAGRSVAIPCTITAVNFLGSVIRISADAGGNSLSFDTFNNPAAPPPTPGDRTTVHFSPADLLVLEG